jgi:hypothetical protein
VKPRLVVVGAGLCGSLLSALLRDHFDVTLIEQGRRKRALSDDIECPTGEINSSINRAEGLGGTTNYWHNALIEFHPSDLLKAGIPPASLEVYYARAWELFLSREELTECATIRESNRRDLESDDRTVAHMVLPRHRANLWRLANARHPGAAIRLVYGRALRIIGDGRPTRRVEVQTEGGTIDVDAELIVVCAGGLATPVLLSRSFGSASAFCGGYHDHPMAYVAKVRLRDDSRLKHLSCTTTRTSEVRAGMVYETGGIKTVLYLRPAINLGLRSLRGPARFILSDLRNDPFSAGKIFSLLANVEAVREALLFKAGSGFRGDYYSVLLLGEQSPATTRGLAVEPDQKPSLNWHVTTEERRSYQTGLARFFHDFSAEIVEERQIPAGEWEFRTAAHHSGASAPFLSQTHDLSHQFFSVTGVPGCFVCDGSLLRAAGIANSGLTLAALSYRLAELLCASRPVAV